MHTLTREVRFHINPFVDEQGQGANGYSGRPCGEGLALYIALLVKLTGPVDPQTGFIVNIVEIDRIVRENVVPDMTQCVQEAWHAGRHIGFSRIADLLARAWGRLKGNFKPATLKALGLRLNPQRTLSIQSEAADMVHFSEKFEFAAMHTLWNDTFSEEKNFQVFGKCAHRSGHGHNYVAEVTLEIPAGAEFAVGAYERTVDEAFIELVDHKNLNADIDYFKEHVPTVENIARFAWQRLNGHFGDARLNSITIWETEKTACTYTGE